MVFLKNSGDSWGCGADGREASSRENRCFQVSEELSGMEEADSRGQTRAVRAGWKKEAGLGQ